jgi:hypothetical protein
MRYTQKEMDEAIIRAYERGREDEYNSILLEDYKYNEEYNDTNNI